MHTVYGTTVHNKYKHVYVTPITVSQAGEDGDDQDDDGQWRWFCNKFLTCRKGKTCYKTTQATSHIKKHGEETETVKALSKRAVQDNSQKGIVMETVSA